MHHGSKPIGEDSSDFLRPNKQGANCHIVWHMDLGQQFFFPESLGIDIYE